MREVVARRSAQRLAVEQRRLPHAHGEQLVAQRVEDDADLALARDRHAPLRDPEQVVDRAVERVDDPAQPGRARQVVALLPQDRVVGPARGEHARGSRARPRGRPRRRGRSASTSPRPRARRARSSSSSTAADGARRRHRDVEEVVGAHSGGRRSAHGRACSIWAASESSVASSPRAPDELDGERQAVGVEAGGHRGRGLAGGVEDAVVRHPRDDALSVHSAPRPWNWPTRNGGPAGPGVSTTSAWSKIASMRAATRRLGGARPGELPGRDERAEPRHRARARLQALGMLDAARRRRGSRAGSARPGSATPSARSRSRARRPRGRASAAARRSPRPRRAARRPAAPARPAAASVETAIRSRPGSRAAASTKPPPPAAASRNSAASATGARAARTTPRPCQTSRLGPSEMRSRWGLIPNSAAERRGDADRAAAVGAQGDAAPGRRPPRRPSRRSSRPACGPATTGCAWRRRPATR